MLKEHCHIIVIIIRDENIKSGIVIGILQQKTCKCISER